jgi:hypothetical protein
MQELWAIICNRGRETANKKPPAGSVEAKGAAAEEENEEDGDEKEKEKEKEDVRSGSSRSRPKPMLATDLDLHRTIVRCHQKSASMEGTATSSFRTGRIVSCALLRVWLPFLAHYACVDDTCVQPGYWSAVQVCGGLMPQGRPVIIVVLTRLEFNRPHLLPFIILGWISP